MDGWMDAWREGGREGARTARAREKKRHAPARGASAAARPAGAGVAGVALACSGRGALRGRLRIAVAGRAVVFAKKREGVHGARLARALGDAPVESIDDCVALDALAARRRRCAHAQRPGFRVAGNTRSRARVSVGVLRARCAPRVLRRACRAGAVDDKAVVAAVAAARALRGPSW